MLTTAAPPEVRDIAAPTPAGELPLVVPSREVYQVMVPSVPSATFVVVTGKVVLPMVPATIASRCAPTVTLGVGAGEIVSVATSEMADPSANLK